MLYNYSDFEKKLLIKFLMPGYYPSSTRTVSVTLLLKLMDSRFSNRQKIQGSC